MRVLLVDDNPGMRTLVALELGREFPELEAIQINDEKEFAGGLEQGSFDLAIIDYQLPWTNGLQVLQAVKARWPECPVIMFTASGDEEIAVEAMKAGLDDYVVKSPKHLARLRAAAVQAMARAREREAARRSEARLRLLAENAEDLIYRYELAPARGFSYVSPAAARIVGYTPEEHYADPDLGFKIVHPDERALLQSLVAGEGLSRPVSLRWLHKDGRTVWVEQRNTRVHDEAGNLVAIEGIVRDVTERKEMEQRLLRAQRLETAAEIAARVAHEFNNLLGPLVAYPEVIKRRLGKEHPVAPFCDAMLEAAREMVGINEDLIVVSGVGLLDPQPLDLNQLVREAVAQVREKPATLEVELDLAADLLPTRGSQDALLKALSQLLANAREAMRDSGRLTLRTRNVRVDRPFSGYDRVGAGEYLRFEVADTGPGIPPEVQDRIFDAFFTTHHGPGRRAAGLGLTIVQALVRDHGGFVDLASEPGRGTTFSLYLPVHRETARVAPPEGPRGGAEILLLVGDDRLRRQAIRAQLEALGYRAEEAESGEEAVEHLQEHRTDLLLLDVMEPSGIDWVKTYRRARQLRPDQRALVLTGSEEAGLRERETRALGGGAVLQMPSTLESLARAVRAELDRE